MVPLQHQPDTEAHAELRALVVRFLGETRAQELFREGAGAPGPGLFERVERALSERIGATPARVLVACFAAGEAPSRDDVALIVDETARLAAENRRLEKLDRLSYELVAAVTHDLRNPLTSIRSFSEILLHRPSMAPGQRAEFLKIVIDETERLGQLVSDVLDLAKLEWARVEWSLQKVDVRDVVTQAADALNELFRDCEVALVVDLPAAPQTVDGDRDRLRQVVLNLLAGALAMAPRRAGMVVARVREDDGRVEVSVHDNGPGIAAEELARVFDEFHHLPLAEPGRPRGSGLGLAISRRIVMHHRGTIAAASTQGEGMTVSFSLPRAAGAG